MEQDEAAPKGEEEGNGEVVEAFLRGFLIGIRPNSGGFGIEFRRLSVAEFLHLSLSFVFLSLAYLPPTYTEARNFATAVASTANICNFCGGDFCWKKKRQRFGEKMD